MSNNQETKEHEKLHVSQQTQVQAHVQDFNDLDSGWAWMILFASFGTCFVLGNSVYAAGIVHSILLDRYRESVSVTSWAGALQTSVSYLSGPLSSLLSDKFSCRTAIILSGVFLSVGYLATAFAPNIEVAIVTCGVLTGIGAGIGYTAAIVVVGFNFKRRRNLALGIALAGIGAGLFVLAPLMQIARDYYGSTGFFFILAAVTAHIIILGVVCFPSKLERHTHMQRRRDSMVSGQTGFILFRTYFKVLANKAMVCLFLCMFFFSLGTYTVYLYLPSYAVSKGFTAMQAAFLVSLSGIISVLGRLLTGVLANRNRINDIILYSGSMTIIGVATFIYAFVSNHFISHAIFVVILGLFFGSCYVTITAVSLKFVGINSIAAALGLQFFFGGIGGLVGPVCAGYLIDVWGAYEESILVAATFIVVGSGFGFVTLCCKDIDDNRIKTLRSNKVEDPLRVYLDTKESNESDVVTTKLCNENT